MDEIARILGFESAPKGVGSSVHNDFVWRLVDSLGLERQSNKYRNLQLVIEHLGGIYDPHSDTSEAAESGGGGTIQNPGLRKVRDLLLARSDDFEQQGIIDSRSETGGRHTAPGMNIRPLGPESIPRDFEYREVDPDLIEDERTRQVREVVARQGQDKWRSDLFVVYGGVCAVTGWDVPQALEAAHIYPYLGTVTNTVSNGLLLRRDVHSLFDAGLLTISSGGVVRISSSLHATMAWQLSDLLAQVPPEQKGGASRRLLAWHEREVFRP